MSPAAARTSIGTVIHPGQPIPDDVTEVKDWEGAVWVRSRTWQHGPLSYDQDHLVAMKAPLTVTAVREQPAEPEPQQAASPLLDLVERYGVEQYSTGYNVRKGDASAATRDATAASTLWSRIAALVPQQPVQARGPLIGAPLWQNDRRIVLESDDITEAVAHGPGPWRPLLVAAPDGDQEHYNESTLFKVYEALGRADIDGAQARDAVTEMQNAGILFRERHPVAAPPREPRTWPKLDDAPGDLKKFMGASGTEYHLRFISSEGRPFFSPWGASGEGAPIDHWQVVDGPLTEVFDDEAGTR